MIFGFHHVDRDASREILHKTAKGRFYRGNHPYNGCASDVVDVESNMEAIRSVELQIYPAAVNLQPLIREWIVEAKRGVRPEEGFPMMTFL